MIWWKISFWNKLKIDEVKNGQSFLGINIGSSNSHPFPYL
jgi:hypothetical protein